MGNHGQTEGGDEYVLSPRALDRNLFKPEAVRRLVDEHVTGTRSHADRLWLLVNLELWLRMAGAARGRTG
jgi:asparagine synthase (glutamine-hydrolysing)